MFDVLRRNGLEGKRRLPQDEVIAAVTLGRLPNETRSARRERDLLHPRISEECCEGHGHLVQETLGARAFAANETFTRKTGRASKRSRPDASKA